MTIHQQIREKMATVSEDDILKEMGYHNLEAGRRTLHKFLDSETIYLWLKKGNFDMKYSSSEAFLKSMAKALGFSSQEINAEIESSRVHLDKITAMQDPYIYINTHFKRQNEPIFALAMMEGRRRIRIDKELILDMKREEVLEYVGGVIREHYEASGGDLPLWGKIYTYLYNHTDESRYVFDTEGVLKKGDNEILESRATLKIGSKEIAQLIGGA